MEKSYQYKWRYKKYEKFDKDVIILGMIMKI